MKLRVLGVVFGLLLPISAFAQGLDIPAPEGFVRDDANILSDAAEIAIENDIIEFEKQDAVQQIKTRKIVHLFMSLVLLGIILVFNAINDQSVIKSLFTVAGYTYGPLLGMFSFGLFTKYQVRDKVVPIICILSPIICYVLNLYIPFGFELLILNGFITFLGLYLIRK